MRNETFARTELLIGEEGLRRLQEARVAVFGIGGVGGHAVEALARSGIGYFLLVDDDVVSESNLNRQIIALRSSVGQMKTKVMKARIADICPETEVETRECFFFRKMQIPLIFRHMITWWMPLIPYPESWSWQNVVRKQGRLSSVPWEREIRWIREGLW